METWSIFLASPSGLECMLRIFRCRSDFLRTSFLTNRHLLLPGTIFGHTKLISCFWSAALLVIGECITSACIQHGTTVFTKSAPSGFTHSSGFSKDVSTFNDKCWVHDYIHNIHISQLWKFSSPGHAHAAQKREVLLYNSCNNSHTALREC